MFTRKNNNKGLSVLLVLVLFLSMMYMFKSTGVNTESYSEIIGLFEDKKVTTFSLNLGSGLLTYQLKGSEDTLTYSVPSVDLFLLDVRPLIEAYNASNPNAPMQYNYVEASNFVANLINWLPIVFMVLMFVVFYMSMSQQGGGKIGNISKARVQQEDQGRKATFADVAGADEE